jgi:hypothetical protein
MSNQSSRRRNGASPASIWSRSRSRSRERDPLSQPPPHRQLRSVTRAAAVIDAAYGNHPRSISRLHDDELACVLSFLSLKELALLVCCSRRFNGVARKERSRGLSLMPTVRSIPFFMHSSLSHHITSVRLGQNDMGDAPITRAMLYQLRSLPRLTRFDLLVYGNRAAAALIRGTSSATATALMQAALPTSLRSFSFTTRLSYSGPPSVSLVNLGAVFLAAAATMSQLTELSIHQEASWAEMRLDTLSALPLLRKLKLNGFDCEIPLPSLKGLSQLRELKLEQLTRGDLVTLCTPPHALRLETLTVDIGISEEDMRALAHLPTLTHLAALLVIPDAWSLLTELPRLRRLSMEHYNFILIDAQAIALSEGLARCAALVDLALSLDFRRDNISDVPEEEQRARWTLLLRGLPNLRRLHMKTTSVAPLLAVLPDHLPRLKRLALISLNRSRTDVLLSQLAHPTLQALEWRDRRPLTEVEVQSLLHNPRLPQLRSCKNLSSSAVVHR